MIKMHQKILIFTHINVFYHNEITYRFKFICYIKDKDHLRIGKFQMEIFNLDWSSVSMKLEYRLSVVRRLKIPFYPSANFVSLIFLKKYLQQKKKEFFALQDVHQSTGKQYDIFKLLSLELYLYYRSPSQ